MEPEAPSRFRFPKWIGPIQLRDVLIGSILLGLGIYSISLGIEQRHQQQCIQAFLSTNSSTTQARAAINLRSELAFEDLVNDLFAAKTPQDGLAAKHKFDEARKKIAKERAAAPIRQFADSRCQDYVEEER